MSPHLAFYVSAGDPNTDFRVCTVNTLPLSYVPSLQLMACSAQQLKSTAISWAERGCFLQLWVLCSRDACDASLQVPRVSGKNSELQVLGTCKGEFLLNVWSLKNRHFFC